MKKLIIFATAILLASPAAFSQAKAGKTDTRAHPAFYPLPEYYGSTNSSLSKKEALKMEVEKAKMSPVNITNNNPGGCLLCSNVPDLTVKEKMKAEVMGIYTCPMKPDMANSKSGKCFICELAFAK